MFHNFSAMYAALAVFWTVFIIIALVCYIFYSIGLYTIAKRRNLRYAGLAWVPVASLWILGSIADQFDLITTGINKKLRLVLIWLAVGLCVVSLVYGLIMLISFSAYSSSYSFNAAMLGLPAFFGLILWGAGITLAVFNFIALHKLYRSASPDNATVFTVLSIIFTIIIPFVVFALRNSDRGVSSVQQNLPLSH